MSILSLFCRPLSTLGLIAVVACQPQYAVKSQEFLRPLLATNALLREFADFNRDYFDDPRLVAVTKDYGYSIIHTQNLPSRSQVGMAKVKPWSSWWYPKRHDYLFNDSYPRGLSPLTKFDLLKQTRPFARESASAFERANYNAMALPWEGLCDAWALASLFHDEPRRPVTVSVGNGSRQVATFNVGDLKALLLKTYEGVPDSHLKFYGQRFTGDMNGWIYPDLYPEQFHRFVEVQLFERQQAFVMDHDAGVEVWNVPVFKANYSISEVPENPNAVFVRMWLYSAESLQLADIDKIGTQESVREYNYVLEGVRNGHGDLEVQSGYWVRGPDGIDSRSNHPDYVIELNSNVVPMRRSINPGIEVSLVDELISRSQ